MTYTLVVLATFINQDINSTQPVKVHYKVQ